MKKTLEHKLGLTLGLFLAGLHLLWSLAVAIAPGAVKNALDWLLGLHHLNVVYSLSAFNPLSAVLLVALTALVGYALGWLLGSIYQRVA